ncbi:hypothetical protein CYY_009194 [Polysphondylium violaceum]|uniref:Uncharacterized protein n=1 Tax=Polysphondylium violaceum TaxID=133409 RepID=A0A8J4PP35_9MYCE|nr:hypothetical protein CYY_009194 [Polysphondylium violaceum]
MASNIINNVIEYALVNGQWFDVASHLVGSAEAVDIDLSAVVGHADKAVSVENKGIVEHVIVDYKEINPKLVELLNREFSALKTITVKNFNHNEGLMQSVWQFNHFNKLARKDQIVVNFNLFLNGDYGCLNYIVPLLEREPFTFTTGYVYAHYTYEDEPTFSFLYGMVKDFNPQILQLSTNTPPTGQASHLRMLHSLAKLNQRYVSVGIKNDYIPLYSLYRFLQSPHLSHFQFQLQFHLIAAIYKDQDANSIITEAFNFNEKDAFEFSPRDYFSYDRFDEYMVYDKAHYLDTNMNTINEDNQIYCPFDTKNRDNPNDKVVPPYSKSLWKECLELLKANRTITELSIGDVRCNSTNATHQQIQTSQLDKDLLDALAANQSIKTLVLNFGYTNNHFVLNKVFLSSLLQQNSTLESLVIHSFYHHTDLLTPYDTQKQSEIDAQLNSLVDSLKGTKSTCIVKVQQPK